MSKTAVYLSIHNLVVRVLVLDKTSSFPSTFFWYKGKSAHKPKAQMAGAYSSFCSMKFA